MHHHACEQPPADGSLVCGRCAEKKEKWRGEWEQQQTVVQADVVLGAAAAEPAAKGKRGPKRIKATHVHQVYKYRCCAAIATHPLMV